MNKKKKKLAKSVKPFSSTALTYIHGSIYLYTSRYIKHINNNQHLFYWFTYLYKFIQNIFYKVVLDVIYYYDSYKTIKKIIEKFDPDDTLSVRTAQEVMGRCRVETNLAFIKSNFSLLCSALISLKEKGKFLSSSVVIINVISEKLSIVALSSQSKSIQTINKVLSKNL